MKNILLYCLFAVVSLSAFAQNGFTNYPCNLGGTISSYLKKSAIAEDNTGNIWIGNNQTGYGGKALLKFDGANWTAYTSFIPSRHVNGLHVDNQNNLWIASDSGLIKYDGVNFTYFNPLNSNLSEWKILSLTSTNSDIWVGTYNGLFKYDGTNFSSFTTGNSTIQSDSILCLTIDNQQNILIGSNSKVIIKQGLNFNTFQSPAPIKDILYHPIDNSIWFIALSKGSYFIKNNQLISCNDRYFDYEGYSASYAISAVEGFNNGVMCLGVNTNSGQTNSGLIEFLNDTLKKYSPIRTLPNYASFIGARFLKSKFSNKIYVTHNINSSASTNFLYSIDSTFAGDYFFSNQTQDKAAYLDINEVKTLLSPGATMNFSPNGMSYEVPKNSKSNTTYSSALWIGGYDQNNQLHMAAETYRQTGVDFWPGPIDSTCYCIDTLKAKQYDRVWKVNRFDIENYLFHYNNGTLASYQIPQSILEWPGNIPYQGLTGNKLAPFVDINNDGMYDPYSGDYPKIKGDQMIFWVLNDVLAPHTETTGQQLGIEIRCSAYAYNCPTVNDSDKVINYTTFYDYEILNTNTDYDSVSIGYWADWDLGNYSDDYIGTNVDNNFGFIMNGDNYDEDQSWIGTNFIGYRDNPPIFACQILDGGTAKTSDNIDNNNNGSIDEPNEKCLLTNTIYYNNDGSPTGNPATINNGQHFFNFLNSTWKDGQHMYYGGDGYPGHSSVTSIPENFIFPDCSDSSHNGTNGIDPGFCWSETNTNAGGGGLNQPGDRRLMINSCGSQLKADSSFHFAYALVFTQDSVALANGQLMQKAISDNQKVKHWFDFNNAPSCIDLSTIGLKENTQLDNISIYPNPTQNTITIDFGKNLNAKIEVYDVLGNLVKGAQSSTEVSYMQINLSDLSNGIYFVKINNTNLIKVIKE